MKLDPSGQGSIDTKQGSWCEVCYILLLKISTAQQLSEELRDHDFKQQLTPLNHENA